MAVNLVVDGYVNGKSRVYVANMNQATPALVLQPSDSGCTVYVGQSTTAAIDNGANSILLPAPISGFKCTIIFTAVGDNTAGHNIQVQSTAANMLGNTAIANAATNVAVAVTFITRSGTAANALIGDYIKIWCNGTRYYFYAFSAGAATPWATA